MRCSPYSSGAEGERADAFVATVPAALELAGGESSKNVTTNQIRDFLHQIRVQVERQVTVLWDRASVHNANRIERIFERYERLGESRLFVVAVRDQYDAVEIEEFCDELLDLTEVRMQCHCGEVNIGVAELRLILYRLFHNN